MKYIVIILHGYDQTPSKYNELKDSISENSENATILIPELRLTTFSTKNPDEIIVEILELIDKEWKKEVPTKEKEPSKRVIIIGHSTGALLARKLYVACCGENEDSPLGKIYNGKSGQREWAQYVERIILLAGMNRGWTINPYLYSRIAFLMRIGIYIGHIMKLAGHEPLAFQTRRGSSFITQLRLQWVSMLRHAELKKVGNVPVIQLLGTKDDIISPDDNIDVLTGNNFIYMEVPESNHMTVLNVLDKKRKLVFEKALKASPRELYENQIIPLDDISINADPQVTDVVFVVHGIRDTGYWTQKIARRVKELGKKDPTKKIASETSTYGYFPMLPFLFPFVRRAKVEWFMEQYTENLVLYPNAKFSFVGHSNGTYLLAKALKEYPACKFENVVFAGSVVPKNYEWIEMIKNKRIKNFFNLVATSDWVVAMFPKAFQWLKLQDIGSGGFDGFDDCDGRDGHTQRLGSHYQLKFVKGGHGAAIEENFWDDIAYFIVHGKKSPAITEKSVEKRPFFMQLIGSIVPIPFLFILFIVLYGLWIIFIKTDGISLYLLASAYIFGVWKIITRF